MNDQTSQGRAMCKKHLEKKAVNSSHTTWSKSNLKHCLSHVANSIQYHAVLSTTIEIWHVALLWASCSLTCCCPESTHFPLFMPQFSTTVAKHGTQANPHASDHHHTPATARLEHCWHSLVIVCLDTSTNCLDTSTIHCCLDPARLVSGMVKATMYRQDSCVRHCKTASVAVKRFCQTPWPFGCTARFETGLHKPSSQACFAHLHGLDVAWQRQQAKQEQYIAKGGPHRV